MRVHQKAKPSMQRRFSKHFPTKPRLSIVGLSNDHSSVLEGRTLFPRSVVHSKESPRLLVSGHNNRKTGARVEVGRWKGSKIVTLTLEERATCPKSCYHWNTCMGNGMPFSRRHIHGEEFEDKLEKELFNYNKSYDSFVVRLHILGDFYSVDYVEKWRHWLNIYSGLKVFGYTARDQYSEIGKAIFDLRETHWNRFAIRFSRYRPEDFRREAVSGDSLLSTLGSVQCPAQLRDDKFCGNCAACWESDVNIRFDTHGRI